eukprot:5069723-Pyramimonas_sp.AAC.1
MIWGTGGSGATAASLSLAHCAGADSSGCPRRWRRPPPDTKGVARAVDQQVHWDVHDLSVVEHRDPPGYWSDGWIRIIRAPPVLGVVPDSPRSPFDFHRRGIRSHDRLAG